MTSEARLLAVQVVSAEVCSNSQAEGIEDRITNAFLAARRLMDVTSLAFKCAAYSATFACQVRL